VLEDFYKPFLQSFPDEKAFKHLKENLKPLVTEVSRQLYNGRSIDRGIDYLSVQIAIEMLERYIDAEVALLRNSGEVTFQRKVVIVENEFIEKFPEGLGGLPIPFALKGKIDLGDSVAGVLHLIDYKTGKIGTKKGKFKGKFDELFTNKDYSKFLQLLIYILMTRDRNQPVPSASFYSMREAGGSFVHAQDLSELEINHEFMDRVEEALGRFLHALLERDSFEHNTNAHYCEYCFTKA
jgi:ATP-dependent exoDNAse (exonuclease V) beta subunit